MMLKFQIYITEINYILINAALISIRDFLTDPKVLNCNVENNNNNNNK